MELEKPVNSYKLERELDRVYNELSESPNVTFLY